MVDVEFRRPELDADGIVVDIGRASQTLRAVLADLNYRNLDDVPAFKGRNTTTEFLATSDLRRDGGGDSPRRSRRRRGRVESLRVTLHESHVAWAAFEGRLS